MPTLPLRLETDVQSKLVDAANDLGGHAFKSANRFLIGVPDLSVQLLGLHHVYIEVKYERSGFNHNDAVKFELTIHQRRFLMDHQASGGCAGWLMVVAMGNDRYAMSYSSCCDEVDKSTLLYKHSGWLIKERGKSWPIEKIVRGLQESAPAIMRQSQARLMMKESVSGTRRPSTVSPSGRKF